MTRTSVNDRLRLAIAAYKERDGCTPGGVLVSSGLLAEDCTSIDGVPIRTASAPLPDEWYLVHVGDWLSIEYGVRPFPSGFISQCQS